MDPRLEDAIARRDAALRAAHGIDAPDDAPARARAMLDYHAAAAEVEQLQPSPARPTPPPDALEHGQAALRDARRRHLLRQMGDITLAALDDDALEARWQQHQQQQERTREPVVTVEQSPARVAAGHRLRLEQAAGILQASPSAGAAPKEAQRVIAIRQDTERPSPFAPPLVWAAWGVILHHRHGWTLEAKHINGTLTLGGITLRPERLAELLDQLRTHGIARQPRPLPAPEDSEDAVLPGRPSPDAAPAAIVSWVVTQIPANRRSDIAVYQRCQVLGYRLTWEQVQVAIAQAALCLGEGEQDIDRFIVTELLPTAGAQETPLRPEQAPEHVIGSEWLDPDRLRLHDGDRPRSGRLRVIVADDIRGVWLGRISRDRMAEQNIALSSQLRDRLLPYGHPQVAILEAAARDAFQQQRKRKRGSTRRTRGRRNP